MLTEQLCECGCGQLAPLYADSRQARGYRQGQPKRFIRGHQRGNSHPRWNGGRGIMVNGYVWVHAPNHPKANNGMVYEHVLIAEKAIGYYLPHGVHIHHVNEIRSENRGSNLVICESIGYHKLLHQRMRALKMSGHVDWRKCPYCKQYDDPSRMAVSTKGTMRHLACACQYAADRKTARGTHR